MPFEIFPELQGYADLAKKKARDGDFWHALDILREVGADVSKRRRRKQQAEQERLQHEKDKKDAEAAFADREITNRQTAEIEDNAQAARKRQARQEEERLLNAKIEPHLPTVQKIRELVTQADMSDDPIQELQYRSQANAMTLDLPKEVTGKYPWLDNIGKDVSSLRTDIRSQRREDAKAARDAAKDDALSNPEWQAVIGQIEGELDTVLQENPEMKLPILLLKAELRSKQPNPDRVFEMYNGLLDGIKSRDEPTSASNTLSGKPLTKDESNESFSNKPMLNQSALGAIQSFGGSGRAVIAPDSLATLDPLIMDKRELQIRRGTDKLVNDGAYDDTPRGRALARSRATEVVDSVFAGKPLKKGKYEYNLSAAEKIAMGDEAVPEDDEPAVDPRADLIKQLGPVRYRLLLEDPAQASIIDDVYGDGVYDDLLEREGIQIQ